MGDFTETITWKDIKLHEPPIGFTVLVCDLEYPYCFLAAWNPEKKGFCRYDSFSTQLNIGVSHWTDLPQGNYSRYEKKQKAKAAHKMS